MSPTANRGDYFLLSKFAYNSELPLRGDVVIFRALNNYFIKRVVGLPGDQIQMKNGRLFINNVAVPTRRIADFTGPCPSTVVCRVPQYEEIFPGGRIGHTINQVENGPEDNTNVFEVPANSYFVLGDNRDNSADSRNELGYVARSAIVGRAAYKYIAGGIGSGSGSSNSLGY